MTAMNRGVYIDLSLTIARVLVYCMVKYVVHIVAWVASGVLALEQARGTPLLCYCDGVWEMYVVRARHLSVLSVVACGLVLAIG